MLPLVVPSLLVAAVGLNDGVDWDDVGYAAALVVAVLTAGALLWRLTRSTWQCLHQISVDTAASRAALPGLTERMAALEAQMRPNGGTSLRDQVTRIETRQIEFRSRMDAMGQDVVELKDETVRQGQRLDAHIDRHGGA